MAGGVVKQNLSGVGELSSTGPVNHGERQPRKDREAESCVAHLDLFAGKSSSGGAESFHIASKTPHQQIPAVGLKCLLVKRSVRQVAQRDPGVFKGRPIRQKEMLEYYTRKVRGAKPACLIASLEFRPGHETGPAPEGDLKPGATGHILATRARPQGHFRRVALAERLLSFSQLFF